jgi:hypothetical protein
MSARLADLRRPTSPTGPGPPNWARYDRPRVSGADVLNGLPFRLRLTGGAHIGARRGEAVLRRGTPRNLGLHIAPACHLFVAIGGPLSETSLFDRVHLQHGASPTYRFVIGDYKV